MSEAPVIARVIKVAVLLALAIGQGCEEAIAPKPPLPLPMTDRIIFESDRHDPLGDIYAMTFDGTDVRRLTSSPVGEKCPRISPDGNWIAYYARGEGDVNFALWLMRANGTEARRIAVLLGNPGCPLWSRASDLVAASGRTFDLAGNEVASLNSLGLYLTSFSVDATEFLGTLQPCNQIGCTLPDIVIIKRDGSGFRHLTGDDSDPSFTAEGAFDPTLSADGMTVLYICRGVSSTRMDSVCTIRWDRTDKKILVGAAWSSPKFSPDGTRVAYICGGDARPTGLCVMDVGGANTVSWPLSSTPRFIDWTPDGSGVVFVCELKDICSIRTDSGALTNLTQGDGTSINPSMVSGTSR